MAKAHTCSRRKQALTCSQRWGFPPSTDPPRGQRHPVGSMKTEAACAGLHDKNPGVSFDPTCVSSAF